MGEVKSIYIRIRLPKLGEEDAALSSQLYKTDPLVNIKMTYDEIEAYADAAIGGQREDAYYNPGGSFLASLPPPPPSLLRYLSDAATKKLPKEGRLTNDDRRKYFSVATAGNSGSDTVEDTKASANSNTFPDRPSLGGKNKEIEAMKQKLMPRALYQTMDLSALVATGVAVEEVLTAHLLPLARAYVAHCRGSSKKSSLPIESVASPGEALSRIFSSSKKRRLNDETYWLPSTLPPTSVLLQHRGSRKATTNDIFDENNVSYVLADPQGKLARERWCKIHGYGSAADLKEDMRHIGSFLVPTSDDFEENNSSEDDDVEISRV